MRKYVWGITGICLLSGALAGCRYLNGDPIWLSSGRKEVDLHSRFFAFGDVEYTFQQGNLPFRFNVYGYEEFGHLGHSIGSPDFSKGGYVKTDSVLRFSVSEADSDIQVEFLVSNGIVRVVGSRGMVGGRVERRKGPLPNDAMRIDICERWFEDALERNIYITVWNTGCSIQIHRLGSYGVVYNYFFPKSENKCASLSIWEIKNLRWYHYHHL